MSETTCSSCMYFKQHYALDERTIFRVYCGHCTCQRVKPKRPDTKICKNYIQKKPDENAFVSKEYLSKKLMDYMLSSAMAHLVPKAWMLVYDAVCVAREFFLYQRRALTCVGMLS